MQYPYRGRHAINHSARLADRAVRITQANSVAQPIGPTAVSVTSAKALAVLPLRAIDLLDALGRALQRLAAAARIRVARSPP